MTDERPYPIVRMTVRGVPEWLAGLLVGLVLLCGLVALYFYRQGPVTANVESVTIQVKANADAQQRQYDFQLKIADRCVKAGLIPIFNGGNVLCQAMPKETK